MRGEGLSQASLLAPAGTLFRRSSAGRNPVSSRSDELPRSSSFPRRRGSSLVAERRTTPRLVIPAQAGIQSRRGATNYPAGRHSRASGNPAVLRRALDPRPRGGDGARTRFQVLPRPVINRRCRAGGTNQFGLLSRIRGWVLGVSDVATPGFPGFWAGGAGLETAPNPDPGLKAGSTGPPGSVPTADAPASGRQIAPSYRASPLPKPLEHRSHASENPGVWGGAPVPGTHEFCGRTKTG